MIERDLNGITVADITRLYAYERTNRDLFHRALAARALPGSWRTYFERRLKELGAAHAVP